MSLIKRLLKKSAYPKHEHDVEFAFASGGIDYYQFKDFSNMPAVRGLKTMVFHEEMRMKCSLEYLQLHCEAVDNILLNKKINIFDIKKLNDQLKQRLDIAIETELIYKLASVVFFDKKEDIKDYDFTYNMQKIRHWKKYNANDFFLLRPLQQLMPSLNNVAVNLQMYSTVVEKLNAMHLENLLPHLPQEKIQTLKGKSFSLPTETRQNSMK
jgi:hypothetical protein